MFKVLIVDDEKMIREGLQLSVDWKSVNCEVVGLASNGEEGLNQALKLIPDIVVTDIKMPVLSGIKMAEHIIKELPNTKFIMITGFSDFKDAKDAIKLSAIDFIQKPIEDEELLSAVENAIIQINRDEVEWTNKHNRKLLDLLEGDSSKVEILKVNKDESNQIVLIQMHDTWLMGAYLSKIMKQSKVLFNEILFEFIVCSDNIFALILKDVEKTILKKYVENFKVKIYEEFDITMSIGISTKAPLDKIEDQYMEAQMALSSKIKHGIGKIIFYEDLQYYVEDKETVIIDYHKMNQLLSEGNKEKIIDYVDDVKNTCIENELYFEESKAIFLDLHMLLIQKIKTNDLEVLHPNAYTSFKLRNARNIDELVVEFKNISMEMFKIVNHNIDKIRTNDKIVDYINENYNKDIQLQDISELFYMSESTISRRIKTRTDMSFSEYLTYLRIDESMKLLKTTDLSIAEISEHVGYTDYRYFSTVFKRRKGVTPTQFRTDNN